GRLPQQRVAASAPIPAATPAPALPAQPGPLTPPPPSQPTPPAGSAVLLLEQLGLKRLRPKGRFLLDSYFANAVQVGREVAGERWPEVAEAAGLPELGSADPAGGRQRRTPVEHPSRLVDGFERVYGLHAPDRIREWGRKAADRWLRLRRKQRRMPALLKAFTEWMDEVRGEPAHVWRQMDPKQFWLVHYGNLYALGRRQPEKACFVWTATYETLLRWAGLANDWYVEEIECGCVSGTFDCVFAIRSVKA
ncbi:MAG TPA: hypothetical protein VK131_03870, partial [Candidatus Acidoferrales bacterium]|nr:hypothetical protein [Candidatus Acidoferrales bacterium]